MSSCKPSLGRGRGGAGPVGGRALVVDPRNPNPRVEGPSGRDRPCSCCSSPRHSSSPAPRGTRQLGLCIPVCVGTHRVFDAIAGSHSLADADGVQRRRVARCVPIADSELDALPRGVAVLEPDAEQNALSDAGAQALRRPSHAAPSLTSSGTPSETRTRVSGAGRTATCDALRDPDAHAVGLPELYCDPNPDAERQSDSNADPQPERDAPRARGLPHAALSARPGRSPRPSRRAHRRREAPSLAHRPRAPLRARRRRRRSRLR